MIKPVACECENRCLEALSSLDVVDSNNPRLTELKRAYDNALRAQRRCRVCGGTGSRR